MSSRTEQLRKDPEYLGKLFAEKGYTEPKLFFRIKDLFAGRSYEEMVEYQNRAFTAFRQNGGKW